MRPRTSCRRGGTAPRLSRVRPRSRRGRARPGVLCLALLLAGGCGHRIQVETVPRQGTLAASQERQRWIVERLRAMRAAEKTERDRARAIQHELERAGVDWRSFIAPMHGSVRGSCCLYGESPKNHLLRQIAQKLNLVRDLRQILGIPDRANDLAEDGSVLDSAFFTNRDVSLITPEEVLRAAEASAPHGTIYVTERKGEGVSEGFWGKDEDGSLFIFILDPKGYEELNTSAEVMGSTILRLAGYHVPYPSIVYLKDLAVDPEARLEEEITQEFVARFRGRRAAATAAITSGYRGPWTYWVFRDRRELRAAQVFAAWINNYDQVDHNTIIELFDQDAGLLRYHIVDTSSAFGSASNRVKEPSAGYLNNGIDVHRVLTTPLRLLAKPFGHEEPWDPHQPIVSPAIGRFDANLEPRLWKPQYPNLAYEDMDEEDAEWAARIVGDFSDELIETIVSLARYSNPEDAAYMADTLKRRRDIIVETYLAED